VLKLLWDVNLWCNRFHYCTAFNHCLWVKEPYNIISFNNFALLIAINDLYSIQYKYYILSKLLEFQYNVIHVYKKITASQYCFKHYWQLLLREIYNFFFLQILISESKLFSTPSPLFSSYFSLSTSVNMAFPRSREWHFMTLDISVLLINFILQNSKFSFPSLHIYPQTS